MWNDRIRIAQRTELDWQLLPEADRALVREALERIDADPISGSPLLHPFRGYWIYLAGGRIRIIYRIVPEARFVVVLKIFPVMEKPTR